MTNEQEIRRAQESGVDGYRADSDDALGELDIYEALVDPAGGAGKNNNNRAAGGPMMAPPMGMAGGGAGAGGAGAAGAGAGGMAGGASGLGASPAGGLGAGAVGSGALGAGAGAGGGGLGGMPGGGTLAAGGSGVGGIDTDGDGIADSFPGGGIDTDGDGIPDSFPGGGIDTDGDGIPDSFPGGGIDTDGDGIPDSFPGDPNYPGINGGDGGLKSPTGYPNTPIDTKLPVGDPNNPGTIDNVSTDYPTGVKPNPIDKHPTDLPNGLKPDLPTTPGINPGLPSGTPGPGGMDTGGMGGGGMGGGGGGAGGGDIAVDPDQLQGAGKAWADVSKAMTAISSTASGQTLAGDQTFGFVTTPVGAYGRFQTGVTDWSAGAGKEFDGVATELSKNAQGYRDNASEHIAQSNSIMGGK